MAEVFPPAVPDPFDRFNRAQGVGRVRDPYQRWAELRRQAPVVKIEMGELIDLDNVPGALTAKAAEKGGDGLAAMKVYSAVSYEAVSDILRNAGRFTSSGYALMMGVVMGRTILEMDPPEHTSHRGLLKQAFTKKALESWEKDLVGPIVDGLIDRFAERGRADLVRELTLPFPVAVIAGMLGIPEDEQEEFHRLAVELISVSFDFKGACKVSAKLREMFVRILVQRRRTPCNDLLSVLAEAELDGQRLDDEAIASFGRLLAPAGAETTYRSSSNLLYGLLAHPRQLEALRSDRSLMPQAIEEGLRWECPLTGIMRMSTEDTEVAGVSIPAGSIVNVNVGAANHDGRRWERAEDFDIFRKQKSHMAFAFGAHACLGAHLARMETRVVLNALLDRLPGLRLDPDGDDVHVSGLTFRSPLSLPVVFDLA